MVDTLNSSIRLIKKLSLSDTSTTAYIKNEEARSGLSTQNITPMSLPKVAALGKVTG